MHGILHTLLIEDSDFSLFSILHTFIVSFLYLLTMRISEQSRYQFLFFFFTVVNVSSLSAVLHIQTHICHSQICVDTIRWKLNWPQLNRHYFYRAALQQNLPQNSPVSLETGHATKEACTWKRPLPPAMHTSGSRINKNPPKFMIWCKKMYLYEFLFLMFKTG